MAGQIYHVSFAVSGIALYASLFEPGIAELDLTDLPASHRDGPDFLNVLKYLDLPQAVAMAAERCPVHLSEHRAGHHLGSAKVAAQMAERQRDQR